MSNTRKQLELITCNICGKKFIPAPKHLYRDRINGKTIFQCSYSCWRKTKRGKEGAPLW